MRASLRFDWYSGLEVLCDQKAARLWLAQLLHHPLQRPAHCCPVRFFADIHNVRQHPQQDAGMIPGKGEVPSDNEAIPAAIVRGKATIPRTSKNASTGVKVRSLAGRKGRGLGQSTLLELVLVTTPPEANGRNRHQRKSIAMRAQARGGYNAAGIQVLVLAREWRFKSSHPHQLQIKTLSCQRAATTRL